MYNFKSVQKNYLYHTFPLLSIIIFFLLSPIKAEAEEIKHINEEQIIATNKEEHDLLMDPKQKETSETSDIETWLLLGFYPAAIAGYDQRKSNIIGLRKGNYAFELFLVEPEDTLTNVIALAKDASPPEGSVSEYTDAIGDQIGINIIYYIKRTSKHSLGLKIGISTFKYYDTFVSLNRINLLSGTHSYYKSTSKQGFKFGVGLNYHYKLNSRLSTILSLHTLNGVSFGVGLSL